MSGITDDIISIIRKIISNFISPFNDKNRIYNKK
nr:MAG TPA: hypothetical protein [Caudoviricetes sp.]